MLVHFFMLKNFLSANLHPLTLAAFDFTAWKKMCMKQDCEITENVNDGECAINTHKANERRKNKYKQQKNTMPTARIMSVPICSRIQIISWVEREPL